MQELCYMLYCDKIVKRSGGMLFSKKLKELDNLLGKEECTLNDYNRVQKLSAELNIKLIAVKFIGFVLFIMIPLSLYMIYVMDIGDEQRYQQSNIEILMASTGMFIVFIVLFGLAEFFDRIYSNYKTRLYTYLEIDSIYTFNFRERIDNYLDYNKAYVFVNFEEDGIYTFRELLRDKDDLFLYNFCESKVNCSDFKFNIEDFKNYMLSNENKYRVEEFNLSQDEVAELFDCGKFVGNKKYLEDIKYAKEFVNNYKERNKVAIESANLNKVIVRGNKINDLISRV